MVACLNEHPPTQFPNTFFDIVTLAASAGGLHAFQEIIRGLPANFPASVLIIQHLPPDRKSLLVDLIRRNSALPVKLADDGMHLEAGIIYVAPPDYHMLVDDLGNIRLNQGAPVNFTRPAIDPLFESIATIYGDRAIVAVLSGMGSDGSRGTLSISARGGKVIVQSTDSSEHKGMPGAAIRTGKADYILPLEAISPTIVSLVTTGACK